MVMSLTPRLRGSSTWTTSGSVAAPGPFVTDWELPEMMSSFAGSVSSAGVLSPQDVKRRAATGTDAQRMPAGNDMRNLGRKRARQRERVRSDYDAALHNQGQPRLTRPASRSDASDGESLRTPTWHVLRAPSERQNVAEFADVHDAPVAGVNPIADDGEGPAVGN